MNQNRLLKTYNINKPKNFGQIIYITDFNYTKFIFWKFIAILFMIFCIYSCINLFDDLSKNTEDSATNIFQFLMFAVGIYITIKELFSKKKILVIGKNSFLVIDFLFFRSENSMKQIYYKEIDKITILKKDSDFKYSFIKDDTEIFSIKKDTGEELEYYKDIEVLLSIYEKSK